MKKLLPILMMILISMLSTAACAAPVLSDGQTTGWIGENNYLFLQNPDGRTAQLPLAIDDLILMTDDELICLAQNKQVVAVPKDFSGSRIANITEADTWKAQQLRLEEDIVYLNGKPVSQSAQAAATDGIYLYMAEKVNQSFVLRVRTVQETVKAFVPRSRDDYAASLSGQAIPEPESMTVTREALSITGTDHQVTVMNLLTGETSHYPATSGETAAACLINGMLYRYLITEDQHWKLESATAVASPVSVPLMTATPRPTAQPPQYTDDDGTIYYGASGKTVKKIQARLAELGYPVGAVDGIYGSETQLAINLFCDAIHVREHPYITRRVQRKLMAKDAPVYDPYLPLKKGDQGISVLFMQIRLKERGYDPGKPDGIYGKMTVAAVARFQADYGIIPGEKEEPGEAASHELLEMLFAPEPTSLPDPDPTATVLPVTPTFTPEATPTPHPPETPGPTPAMSPKPASPTDL